eukprot:m.305552 g.305552  ORF g.305552 m.305552 type:complete len:495 (-) comp16449_c0_seq60:723-2207(-)
MAAPRRSGRARRPVLPVETTAAERMATAEPLFEQQPFRTVGPFSYAVSNQRLRGDIMPGQGITLYVEHNESEPIDDSKEVFIVRKRDQFTLSGKPARAAVDMIGPGGALVDPDEYNGWIIYKSTKSPNRSHEPGKTFLLKYPALNEKKKRKNDDGFKAYYAQQGQARVIQTWNRELLITDSFDSTVLFDIKKQQVLQVVQKTLHDYHINHGNAKGTQVIGDSLYIPITKDFEDEDNRREGLLKVSLPDLHKEAVLLCTKELPVKSRLTGALPNGNILAMSMEGDICIWDKDGVLVDEIKSSHPRCCFAPAICGRFLFYAYACALDLETKEEYEILIDEANSGYDHDALCVSPGESETEFRLFVPGPKESTLEIIYDLKEAIEERKKGNDEFEIKYNIKRKIEMPAGGPSGYRGPSGYCLLGNKLYVNCSLFAFVIDLTSDGHGCVWSENHAEGDTNEIWDGSPVHADSEGGVYVSTALEASNGRCYPVIKRFAT